MGKYKRWLDNYWDGYMICCLLSASVFYIMYIASLNFNVNGVEVQWTISKQLSVLSVLQLWLLTRICETFYPFPNAPLWFDSFTLGLSC